MRYSSLIFLLLTLAILKFTACTDLPAKVEPFTGIVSLDSTELIKRGEYLVSIIGCDDCHSPKKHGPHGPEIIPELRLSGFQQHGSLPEVDVSEIEKGWALFSPDLTGAVGPWGKSFAANLTSDASGIGLWSEEQFFRAIRDGKYKGLEGSRPLLPPMPWFIYRNMTDEDLKSIFTYLKTVPAVRNIVPAPVPLADLNSKDIN
jgi:hypothetical protein